MCCLLIEELKNGTRTQDPLTQCIDLRADDSNRKAARRIIGIASRD